MRHVSVGSFAIFLFFGILAIFFYYVYGAPTPEVLYEQARVPDNQLVDSQMMLDTNHVYGMQATLIGNYDNFYQFTMTEPYTEAKTNLIVIATSGYYEGLWAGVGDPPCAIIDDHYVPAGIAPRCIDENKKVIRRENFVARFIHSL